MISAILKFVHVVSGVIAFGAGAWVLFGFLKGKLFKKWAIIFLQCTLVANATGLLFPVRHFPPSHWVAMCAVYVSGVAVLAYRRYGLAGIWALLFALSIMLAWCLDILVVIAHIFEMLIPAQHKPFLITESTVTLLFVELGLFIVKRYRDSQVELIVRKR